MLPELLISKFKSRIRSSLQYNPDPEVDFVSGVDSNPRLYLHSRRRYLINSIPLLSIVALLVGFSISITINLFGPFGVFGLFGWFNSECYATTSTIGDSTASITLDTSDVVVNVVPGETGYASKSITVSTNNTESYALTITAPAVLKNESTNSTNPWSYAYGQSGELSTMSYTNFDGNTKELESGIESNGSTKTLAFSSTFAEGLASGHYKAEVILGLTATPKAALSYQVVYNLNGGNAGLPTASSCTPDVDVEVNTCDIVISNSTPVRDGGYTFWGWNTTQEAITPNSKYSPGKTITLKEDLTLYAIWNKNTKIISYDNSGGTNGPNAQVCTSTDVFCSFNVSPIIPNRSGYTFYGWSSSAWSYPYSIYSNNISTYVPGNEARASIDITLSAVWNINTLQTTPGFNSISTMQQMTPSICASASYGEYKDLRDIRDGNTYRVVKFRDDRCWMTQNLRIINTTISSANSNLSSGSFQIPSSDISSLTSENAEKPAAYISDSTGYYNWYTATAGVGNSSVPEHTNVSQVSICPKGWTLPTGGYATEPGESEFMDFFSAEGILFSGIETLHNKAQGTPYNLLYTGYILAAFSNMYREDSLGVWWSRTASYNDTIAGSRIDQSDTYNSNSLQRGDGVAIRCVAKN